MYFMIIKDEFDKMVHPDDIPIEMPEGKWRYGKHHKKVNLHYPWVVESVSCRV